MNQMAGTTVKLIDISLPLHQHQPIWPDSSGFSLQWTQRIDQGDPVNNSQASIDVHFGTHIDVPFHFIDNGGLTVEEIPLDVFVGPCSVIHLPHLKEVTADELSRVERSINNKRLLIRTDNSMLWSTGVSEFRADYTAISPDAAKWITEQGIRLVGIDYLSIGDMKNGEVVHRILLESGIVVLEGLNLSHVAPDDYELLCLPINIVGAEGAPARAILRRFG